MIILNSYATPIGQIVLPHRNEGANLRTSNMEIKPGTREIFITSANDSERKSGAGIFTRKIFASANELYIFQ